MRILAIRGQNLASLAEPFEIDLTAEPIASTGLFAITGDTGAGKSTMLDALCLALYGQYPRTKGGSNEKNVIDVSGDAITETNPVNILRRNASAGFAEVDFLGMDGISYRARWTVRRARGKPTGKAQEPDRTLSLLPSGDGVAAGAKNVLAAVVERTGLTFEQFRRTALLAQGEFDAFLLASEADRAELLEKITGTAIYSRISSEVYRRRAEIDGELQSLQKRRDDIGLMSAEDRSAAEQSAADAGSRLDELKAERDAVDAIVKASQALAIAEKREADALDVLMAARQTFDGAAADRERLAMFAKVEPLRRLAEQAAALQEEAAALERTADERKTSADAARRASDEAKVALEMALEDEQQLERTVREHEPIWSAAARLDDEIAFAEPQLIELRAAVESRKTALRDLETEQSEIAGQLADATRCKAEIDRALAAAPGLAMLSQGLTEIVALVRRHGEDVAALRDVETQARDAGAAMVGIAEAISSVDADAGQIAEALQRAEAELADTANAASSDEINCLGARLRDVELTQSTLVNIDDIAQRFSAASHARDAALERRNAATQAVARCEASRSEALARLAELTRAREEMNALVDLANATLSEKAADLRAAIVEGEPCPVCGSRDHPSLADDATSIALAGEVRQRKAALDREIVEMEASRDAAVRDLAQANADASLAASRIADAEFDMSNAAQAYAQARAVLLDIARRLAIADVVEREVPLQPAGPRRALHVSLAQEQQRVSTALAAAQRSAEKRARLQAEHAKLSRSLAALKERRAGLQVELSDKRQQREVARTRIEGISSQSARTRAQLAPHIGAARVDPRLLDEDRDGLVEALRNAAAAYARTLDDGRVLDADVEALSKRATAVDALLPEARRMLDSDSKRETSEAARVAGLRERRAGLLGGEATESHRSRVLQTRDEARARLQHARQRHDELIGRAITRLAEWQQTTERRDDAMQRAAAANAQLAQEAMQRGFEVAAALSILAAAGAAPEIEARLARIDRDVATAAATLHARRTDTAAARQNLSAVAGDRDISGTAARLADLEGCIEAERNALAAVRARLEADDELCRKVASLDGEIVPLRERASVWRDVDAAIGQKDGAKFRRFAQGITLGHLVHLANQQLAALNPRYVLRRGTFSDLSLEVVDRDMGDEVRTPRSLSGGERFLVSLGLALALSGLEGRLSFVDTLFIDEGFGALDADTLDMAIDALEGLQGTGRKVGVVTHVAGMIERIPVQVRVEKRGGGRSVVRIRDVAAGSGAA